MRLWIHGSCMWKEKMGVCVAETLFEVVELVVEGGGGFEMDAFFELATIVSCGVTGVEEVVT